MISICTVTGLYPNSIMPGRGPFVENRLRHLVASGQVSARVVAPVPMLPWFAAALTGLAWYKVPRVEERFGLKVTHPRYFHIPKIGRFLTAASMARTIVKEVRKLQAEGEVFDLIDAHYFYPDGVAAVIAGEKLGLPVVVTARGSDLNVHCQNPREAAIIKKAAEKAASLITVSAALKQKLVDLGIAPERVHVLRNGVDLKLFCPGDRTAAKAKLGFSGKMLLSVGNLIPLKGQDLVIKAMALLPDMHFLIAGSGPSEATLKALAKNTGVSDRVHFVGRIMQDQLPAYYQAADLLILASIREGMANILLESLACGTPVVASDIPGMDEVIGTPESGRLMAARTPEALADAVNRMFDNMPDRAATRAYAEQFDWVETTEGQINLFREILARKKTAAS